MIDQQTYEETLRRQAAMIAETMTRTMASEWDRLDWLAGLAFHALLSSNATVGGPEEIARDAYTLADAMMAERGKRDER